MEKTITLKIITEINESNGNFTISVPHQLTETELPVLFHSKVLEVNTEINNVKGKQGDLLLSYSGNIMSEKNKKGELILDVKGDDTNKYVVSEREGDLLYVE